MNSQHEPSPNEQQGSGDTVDSLLLAQLTMLVRGVATKRFHTVPCINQETVGHHSALVAGLIYLLWPESTHLLVHAIMHDLQECVLGDIPSPGKRMFVDRTKLKAAEANLMGIFSLPELTPVDERRLKIADILAGMVTCSLELTMGNKVMTESMANYQSYLCEIGPHEHGVYAIANHLNEVFL